MTQITRKGKYLVLGSGSTENTFYVYLDSATRQALRMHIDSEYTEPGPFVIPNRLRIWWGDIIFTSGYGTNSCNEIKYFFEIGPLTKCLEILMDISEDIDSAENADDDDD